MQVKARDIPIRSVQLSLDDIKTLSKRLISAVEILGDEQIRSINKPDEKSDEEFRLEMVDLKARAFQVTVTITGSKGDTLVGVAPDIFDSPDLPEPIASVYLTNITQFRTVARVEPNERFELFLDFRKPPLLDANNPVSAATPNNSNLTISGMKDAWIADISQKVQSLIDARKINRMYLHRSFVYDGFLWLVWFPFGIYVCYKMAPLISGHISSRSEVLGTISYVWVLFIMLMVYRAAFGYTKWAFPTVELKENSGATSRHRAFWLALVIGLVITILTDAFSLLKP